MAIAVGRYPLGNTYLDIPEFARLCLTRRKFEECQSANRRRDYFNAFTAFLDYMVNYANLNFGGITDEEAALKIFGNTKRITKNVSRARLLAAKYYAEVIKVSVINDSMMPNVDELVTNLLSEFEDVLMCSEQLLHHNAVDSKAYIPSTYSFTLTDIMSAADQLMFAYATQSMDAFDYRNTQPYVMVQVRQIIENATFGCIGIERITNQSGSIASGVITETLRFLIESQTAPNYSINLPINPSLLLELYKWSCSFVHKGTLDSGYKIFFAYYLAKKLLVQPIAPVQIYDGTYHLRHEYGDIRIEQYNQMKIAYTNKINPNNKRIIEWKEIENVNAYVISL